MIFCKTSVSLALLPEPLIYSADIQQTELLDNFTEKETLNLTEEMNTSDDEKIGFRNVTFAWSNDTDGSLTPSKRNFALRIHDELLFSRGHINLIIGPTGSGKTSLLMALLGASISQSLGVFLKCLKAKCTLFHLDLIHGSICQKLVGSLMQHRNRGC
jgi:ABC-type siderophore export system fused ATPase/permease subunit